MSTIQNERPARQRVQDRPRVTPADVIRHFADRWEGVDMNVFIHRHAVSGAVSYVTSCREDLPTSPDAHGFYALDADGAVIFTVWAGSIRFPRNYRAAWDAAPAGVLEEHRKTPVRVIPLTGYTAPVNYAVTGRTA